MSDDVYRLHRLDLGPGGPLFAQVAEAVPGLSRHKARAAITAGLLKEGKAPLLEATLVPERRLQATLDLRQGIPAKPHLARTRQTAGPALRILWQDATVIVVDKASGVLSAPEPEGEQGHVPQLLRRILLKRNEEAGYVGVVHRIDKDTSGCLVLARTPQAQRILSGQFAGGAAGREYLALVSPAPRQDQQRIEGRLGRGVDGRRTVVLSDQPGKDAVTRYQVLERFGDTAELALVLETGRTHQIRVHLADLGSPVMGDRVYGAKPSRRPGLRAVAAPAERLMLHAFRIAFDHPLTGERIVVEAPTPEAYRRTRRHIGGSEHSPLPPVPPRVVTAPRLDEELDPDADDDDGIEHLPPVVRSTAERRRLRAEQFTQPRSRGDHPRGATRRPGPDAPVVRDELPRPARRSADTTRGTVATRDEQAPARRAPRNMDHRDEAPRAPRRASGRDDQRRAPQRDERPGADRRNTGRRTAARRDESRPPRGRGSDAARPARPARDERRRR
jgi:23S rRNA pseudouridine1911/1915/1917 synthase